MKRVILIVILSFVVLIALAMWWKQTEAVTGLVVALAAALPKLIEKVS